MHRSTLRMLKGLYSSQMLLHLKLGFNNHKNILVKSFCNKRIAEHYIYKRMLHSSQYCMIRRLRRKEKDFVDPLIDVNIPEPTTKPPKQLLDEAATFEGEKGSIKYNKKDIWLSDPYEPIIKIKKEQIQGKYFLSPDGVNPADSTVILFPGQGTQYVGMGKDLLEYPNVKEMYEVASEILDYDLLKLSCEGPAHDLNQTKFQQPAILLASLAAIEKLRQEEPNVLESCAATAGFSVGEIAALTFSGALSFENAVRLVKVRGEAMQIASEMNRSGMMTVFYGPDSKLKFACSVAKEYCTKIGLEEVDCKVANYLFPHCKVVAGNEEALEFIIKNQEDFKLRRIKRLNVSGAFHTNLMKPAAHVFGEALKNTPISRTMIPVYSNVDGRPYKGHGQILYKLPKQIYSPVCWEQTLHTIYMRPTSVSFPKTYECGPGSSLKSILKMVNAKAWAQCVSIKA